MVKLKGMPQLFQKPSKRSPQSQVLTLYFEGSRHTRTQSKPHLQARPFSVVSVFRSALHAQRGQPEAASRLQHNPLAYTAPVPNVATQALAHIARSSAVIHESDRIDHDLIEE